LAFIYSGAWLSFKTDVRCKETLLVTDSKTILRLIGSSPTNGQLGVGKMLALTSARRHCSLANQRRSWRPTAQGKRNGS